MAKVWGFDRLIDEIDQIMATNDNYIRIEKEKQNSLKKLKKRLGKLYEAVTLGTVKSMAWFVCRKAE